MDNHKQPENDVHYIVDIDGEWVGDSMPADEFYEETAVKRTVKRVVAGGTYEARIIFAEWPDGTFVNYEA